jgi:hypothetical protein
MGVNRNAPWNPIDQFSFGFLNALELACSLPLRKLQPLEQPSQKDLNALSISE